MKGHVLLSLVVMLILSSSGILQNAYATTIFPPSSYSSFNDSPFFGTDFTSGYFHLEDFEDGILTPGMSITPTGTFPSPDPLGVLSDGLSYRALLPGPGGVAHVINFDETTLGNYPTHVGIVPVHVEFASLMTIEFYDSSNNLIDSNVFVPGLFPAGNGVVQTDDLFYGVIDQNGVSRIEVIITSTVAPPFDNSGIDHFQYGYLPAGGPVGGTSLSIDTTSLLLAGAHTTASWMIPVIMAAVGFGLLFTLRKSH